LKYASFGFNTFAASEDFNGLMNCLYRKENQILIQIVLFPKKYLFCLCATDQNM